MTHPFPKHTGKRNAVFALTVPRILFSAHNLQRNKGLPPTQDSIRVLTNSAGRYTGSYRIPVFIFLTIWIFKIPQYRCHLNNVRNTTPLERGLFSLLHFGEDTAVCVTKRESSETEALVECDEREEVIHNIHIDRTTYPPSAASAPASHTH